MIDKLQAEISAHGLFQHPAVPELLEVVDDPVSGERHLVFPFAGLWVMTAAGWATSRLFPGEPPELNTGVPAGSVSSERVLFNVALAEEAARAVLPVVAALHARGLKHSDVKPEQLVIKGDVSGVSTKPMVGFVDMELVTSVADPNYKASTLKIFSPAAHGLIAAGATSIAPATRREFDSDSAVISVATITFGCHPYEPTADERSRRNPYKHVDHQEGV